MKPAIKSWTLWFNFIALAATELFPEYIRIVCDHKEWAVRFILIVNMILRVKTTSAVKVGGGSAVAVLAALLLQACSSVPMPTDKSKYYRKDISIETQGRKLDGVAVLPSQQSYQIVLKPKSDMDLLLIKSCHRELVVEKASGGWFSKNEYRLNYAPVDGMEDVGVCPLKIDALETGTNQYSGAFIDFESDKYQLPYTLQCNGETKIVNGTGVCQARIGTYQGLSFLSPVRFAPAEPNGCPEPTKREGHFEIQASLGECLYTFDTQDRKRGRLTVLGYDGVMIRKAN